jgi:Cysteine rich repeat
MNVKTISAATGDRIMVIKFAFAIAVAALLPNLAFAEPGALRGACRDDMKALCGSIQPGGGRLRDCMREHRTQLSSTCKIAIADRMLERKAAKRINGSASEHQRP